MSDDIEHLEDKAVWQRFREDFLLKPGTSLLGLGQTSAGKTQKAYQIAKYLVDVGDLLVWIDSGKSDEILPLFDFGLPVRIIIPRGCTMEAYHPSCPVEVVTANTPRAVWRLIEPGKINVISVRQFFYLIQGYGRYISEMLDALIQLAFEKKLPPRLAIFCDEFSNVCPGEQLQMSKSMKTSAIKVAFALKNLRSMGIRMCAFDQSYTDVFPPARKQFQFFLVCRSPGIPAGVEILGDYRYLFRKLKVWQAYMIFPQYAWDGKWRFRLFEKNPDAYVNWSGKAKYRYNSLREVEDDVPEDDDPAAMEETASQLASA